jgi:hypothetical protein
MNVAKYNNDRKKTEAMDNIGIFAFMAITVR